MLNASTTADFRLWVQSRESAVVDFGEVENDGKMSFECELCNKGFKQRQSLFRHCRNRHEVQLPWQAPRQMVCPECSKTFANNEAFDSHLPTDHGYVADIQKLSFPSEADFLLWKKTIEDKEIVKFVVRNSKKSVYVKHVYYRCNRDGPVRFKTMEDRKRDVKIQGSRKTNNHCPSRITAAFSSNGHVDVEYCSSHFGHKLELRHVPIPTFVKEDLAAKVATKTRCTRLSDAAQTSLTETLKSAQSLSWHDCSDMMKDFKLELCKVRKRHVRSKRLSTSNVVPIEEDDWAPRSWTVFSTSGHDSYTITLQDDACKCEVTCHHCQACSHKYSCTCKDSSVYFNMCKHIHLLCRYLSSNQYPPIAQAKTTEETYTTQAVEEFNLNSGEQLDSAEACTPSEDIELMSINYSDEQHHETVMTVVTAEETFNGCDIQVVDHASLEDEGETVVLEQSTKNGVIIEFLAIGEDIPEAPTIEDAKQEVAEDFSRLLDTCTSTEEVALVQAALRGLRSKVETISRETREDSSTISTKTSDLLGIEENNELLNR